MFSKKDILSIYVESSRPRALVQLPLYMQDILLTKRSEEPILFEDREIDYEDCLLGSESEKGDEKSEEEVKPLEYIRGIKAKPKVVFERGGKSEPSKVSNIKEEVKLPLDAETPKEKNQKVHKEEENLMKIETKASQEEANLPKKEEVRLNKNDVRSKTVEEKAEKSIYDLNANSKLRVEGLNGLLFINSNVIEINKSRPIENQVVEAFIKYEDSYFPDCIYMVNEFLKIDRNMPLWYAFHPTTRSSFGPLSSDALTKLVSQKTMNKSSFVRLLDNYLIEGQKPFSFFRLSSLFSVDFIRKIKISSLVNHSLNLRAYQNAQAQARHEQLREQEFRTMNEMKKEEARLKEMKRLEIIERRQMEQRILDEEREKERKLREKKQLEEEKRRQTEESFAAANKSNKLHDFLNQNSIYGAIERDNVKIEKQNVDDLFGEPEMKEAPKKKKFKKVGKSKAVELDIKVKYN